MWTAFAGGATVVIATGARFFVDRRVGELSAEIQATRETALRERIATLTVQVEPRRLAAEQMAALVAAAHEHCFKQAHISVTAANSNNEAQTYALDFVNAFRAAGCTSDLELPIPGLKPDVQGIHLGVRDATRDSPDVLSLARALTAGAVEFSVSSIADNFFHESAFVLIIGAKPK